ncbi:hypothetical protein D3C87_81450 [compost metagenome]
MHISSELNEDLEKLRREMIYSSRTDWNSLEREFSVIRDTNFHVLEYCGSLIRIVYRNFDALIKESAFHDNRRKQRVIRLAQPIYDYLDSIKVFYELEK